MAIIEPLWTIDELNEQVALALSVDYDGTASGRVRDVPDLRTIRYYSTIGVMDKPAEMRGRKAFYSRRHLLQIVAIKRLQATGISLAEVQQRLLGLSDRALEPLARLPDVPMVRSTEPTTAEPVGRVSRPVQTALESRPTEAAAEPSRGEDFWKAPPVAAPEDLVPIQGVPLSAEVTLLLEGGRPLSEDDLQAIRTVAAPLLHLLQTRRLPGPRPERRPA
jgi:DNA-binding transcriptional MerR regulator